MAEAEVVQSDVSLVLDLPPSCLQFSPLHPEYFVVGTYNLQKETGEQDGSEGKPQSRNGSLVVFSLRKGVLNLVQTELQAYAVLDLRFHTTEGKRNILAVVSSTGTVGIYTLDPARNSQNPLSHVQTSHCEDEQSGTLFLQCQWQPGPHDILGVTTSTGEARLLKLDHAWAVAETLQLEVANTLEAWSIAFSPHAVDPGDGDPHFNIYCGGDDSVLRYASYSREPDHDDHKPLATEIRASTEAISLKGRHEAGVTAVLPLSLRSSAGHRLVLTGSYDDTIRLFSIQDPHESYGAKVVRQLASKTLDGGVWRMDLVEVSRKALGLTVTVLASCMHAGPKVVQLRCPRDSDEWEVCVLARLDEHKSMNYASHFVVDDVQASGKKLTLVSTSFYDRLLCVWKYELP